MPSLDPSIFLPVLVIVLAMITRWRAAIALVGAFLIAVLVIGVYDVVDRFDQESTPRTVTGPPTGADPAPGSLSSS